MTYRDKLKSKELGMSSINLQFDGQLVQSRHILYVRLNDYINRPLTFLPPIIYPHGHSPWTPPHKIEKADIPPFVVDCCIQKDSCIEFLVGQLYSNMKPLYKYEGHHIYRCRRLTMCM